MEAASGQSSSGGRDVNVSTSVDYAPPDSSADTSISTASMLASDGAGKAKTMPSDELLATIIEMRLAGHSRTGSVENGKSSTAPSSLDTLDMCHKNLQDIPDEMVEVIRDEVVRLALGYNSIYALPRNFSKLSRLRYLNVRSNVLSTFPEMLAEMPSLEILDISRNKIRKLPTEPGQLVNLRVLCISHNRLRRLPTWMIQMRHLRILKIDDNPIQWPPPHISILPPASEESPLASATKGMQSPDEKEKAKASERAMQLWIVRMKRWMKENAAQEDERERQRLLPHSSREAGGEGGHTRGHARGKSSMASGSSTLASAAGHLMSPPQAQRYSPSRGQPAHEEDLRKGASHSLDPFDSSPATEQAGAAISADDPTSTMSGAGPFTASPERAFRMRPLMLIRTASGRINPRSASGGSPSGPDSAIGDWEGTLSTAPSSASTVAAMESFPQLAQRKESGNQTAVDSTVPDSEQREHPISPSTGSMNEAPQGMLPPSASLASLYSVQSAHDEGFTEQHRAGAAELLAPLRHPSPSRSVTPTPQNKDPLAPLPESTSKTLFDTDAQAGYGQLTGHEDLNGVSPGMSKGEPRDINGNLDYSSAPLSMPRPSYGHGRTQSHSSGKSMGADGPVGSGLTSSARSRVLSSKQSLPDLRASKFTASSMARESSIPTSSSSSYIVSSSGSTNGVVSNSGTSLSSSSRAMASSTSSSESQPPIPVRRRPVAITPNTALASAATSLAKRGESSEPIPPSSDVSQRTVEHKADADTTAQATPKAAVLSGLPPDRAVSVRRAALLDAAGLNTEGLASPSLPRTPTKTASRDSSQQQHERDSYFRRLSTFPSTLVASSCPPSVLRVIDASRGILFALSQIYTALKQYILFCTDERICAQIQRVLDVAADTLAKLIDSLDRFDSLALKGQNSPASVAAVMDASRDSVITFRQVVSVLQLQLVNLLKSADLRYTRSLMVMLYGATVEVSTSWAEFTRQRESGHTSEAGAQMSEHRGYGYSSATGNGLLLTNGSLASGHLPSIAEGLSPQSVKSAMGETPSPARATELQSRPQAKREGGSFTQDISAGGTAASENASAASPLHLERPSHSKEASIDWAPDTPSRHRGTANRRRDGLLAGSAGLATAVVNLPTKSVQQAGTGQEIPDQTYTLPAPPMGMATSAPPGSTRFEMGEDVHDSSRHMFSAFIGRDGSGSIGTPAHGAVSDGHGTNFRPPMIDHHLLSLVQQVTSAASGVWTTLFDHLSSLGINGQNAPSVNGVFSPETTPILGPNRVGGLSRSGTAKGAMSSSSGASGGDLLKPARDEKSTRAVSPSPSAANSTGPSTTAPHPHSQSARKLNVLREHCLSAAELTKRLQHTLEKVQDDLDSQNSEGASMQGINGASKAIALSALVSPVESRRLVDDSIAFVKAVTNLLVQIKTLSISHDTLTAPDLRKVLAGLATGCSNLSVHLHFCAPRGSAAASTGLYRPGVGDENSRRQVFAGGEMNGNAPGMARRKEQDGGGARGGIAMAPGESQGSGHATSRSASSAASLQQQTQGQQQQQQLRHVPALPTRT
ncbi:hypothetical protein BCV69DRAFT_282481 [Microstroma glucosiphilum]|uniref:RAM signaling network component n=1 Tax=Pseudomicrostroma glucosiphilum TaxID=1684307 RepID=A0A316U6X5_9BASI|nr:hypothetical protein BCV69DRAFT_282481 [Pseudomicrostroma glucosiphilum]PWN20980.1 hypothetical protein BCV69DRAFT_282481 [Pseudomicrostroma glucosiphilum]